MRIAVIDDYERAAERLMPAEALPGGVELVAFPDHVADPDKLVQRLLGYDGVCRIRERTSLTGDVLSRLPRLRLILATGSRNRDSIDLRAADRLGITVCETTALSTPAVELCWALILSTFRRVQSESESVRTGGWQLGVGNTLGGKRLGILGLGRHGSRVARIAHAFDMTTVAWSPNLTEERAAQVNTLRVDKDVLFAYSDAVTIHMPLSDRSRGIVGRRELSLLQAHAFLVNISRGPLVDEEALIDALTRRTFAGYAADVFDTEPLPTDHPLRSLANVLATPHIGFAVEENLSVFYRDAIENLHAYLNGDPIRVLTAQDQP